MSVSIKEKKDIPIRLYKYRTLSSRTLDMLVSDHVYYADPSTFNDPLDTRPSLKVDVDAAQLQEILSRFIERRVKAEMRAAAKTIKYSGPRTISHIKRHSRRRAEQLLAEIAYNATDPEYGSDDPTPFFLANYIEEELLRQYGKGIVSLAERATCPLMWSHHGDQHHGVCIGYSVPERTASNVHKVRYGAAGWSRRARWPLCSPEMVLLSLRSMKLFFRERQGVGATNGSGA